MPRKPNYNFERMERDRLKAAKKARSKAEKEQKKAEAAGGGAGETPPGERDDD